MVQHAQLVVSRDLAYFNRIEAPLFKHAENFRLASFLRHQQHALLRFAQHDFIRTHARLALRDAIKFNFDAHTSAPTHLAGRAGKSRRAHILNTDDGSCPHGLKASLEEQLFQKRIADLHIRTLRLRGFAEFFAGHGGAVNAIASGFRAHVDHRIALARCSRVEDFVFAHQSERECIH